MIINIENEKGLKGQLNFESIWTPMDSYMIKKHCCFLNDYSMLDKMNVFKNYLETLNLVKNNFDTSFLFFHVFISSSSEKEKNFYDYLEKLNLFRSSPCNTGVMFSDNLNVILKDKDFNDFKDEKSYGFINFRNFIGASSNTDFKNVHEASLKGLGIEGVSKILENKEMLKIYKELYHFISKGDNYPFASELNKYKKIVSKIESLKIIETNVTERLVTNDAFLIYFPKSNGYLDYKGNVVPLSGARLFETAIQAERTVKARSIIHNTVIVAANISLTGITNQIPIPEGGLGNLGDGIANLEKRKIKENLNKLTMEDLENQIKILKEKLEDNKVEEPVIVPESSVKRRRM